MAKNCIGNLKSDCSGKCPDYHECLEKTIAINMIVEMRD
jgi:hypothetical protein